MTQLLLIYHPTFLAIEEPWVDNLLELELNINYTNEKSSLMLLYSSELLHELDFHCERYIKLLNT